MSGTKPVMPPPPPPPLPPPLPPPPQLPPQPFAHAHQGPPPARPLPPIPIVPSFLSLDVPQNPPAKSRSLSVEDLRKLWHERVDLMFTSVNAREQFGEVEKKLHSWRLLGQSSRKASLSAEDNALITAQIRSLELQCDAKKKEVYDVVHKLTATDFWPALKPPDFQSVEAKFLGMKQHISELRDSVNDLNATFSALLKSKDNDYGTNSKDSGERPLKRRRLDEEGATTDSTEITLPSNALEKIQERLSGVDCQLSDLQNDIFQRNSIMEDEIDARLEEVDICPDDGDTNPSATVVAAAVQTETAKCLEVINVMGEQLGEVVQEVANLIIHSKGTDEEATRVRQETEGLKAVVAQLESLAYADDKLVQQNNEQIEVLAATLHAYISQTPPAPKPVIPNTEYLMEELEEGILSNVSKHVTRILENIRNEVSSMLEKESAAMYQNLWPKIELILRMVDTVIKATDANAEPEEQC